LRDRGQTEVGWTKRRNGGREGRRSREGRGESRGEIEAS